MEIKKLGTLISRNNKLYFKDKMQFFASLITPMILIFLFLTFLGNVYKSSISQIIPQEFAISDNLINVFTSSWLFSSILATSCITVAFCSNIMIVDKINKTNQDFKIAPVKQSTVQVSYFISNFISTFIVCGIVLLISLIYFLIVGWYFSFVDILFIILNIILTSIMGSLIASIIWLLVASRGAQSALCTLVSSIYGFLCGAYMPISQFSTTFQNLVGFVPGTYSTILFRNFYMNGILNNFAENMPSEIVEEIKTAFDCKYSFYNNQVSNLAMFLIIIGAIAVLFGIYLFIIYLQNRKFHKKVNAKKQIT